jgi:tRNA A37 threonylcarbamoyladenosine synthetase subunit TsaC/SUA5/YrdC
MPATPDLLRRARTSWRRLQAQHPGWHVGSASDVRLRNLVQRVDWSRAALTITEPLHLDLAARIMVLGGIACHPYANFYVFSARPSEAIVRYVNRIKGRPPQQAGSVVTTPRHIDELFDWTRLPAGLDPQRVRDLIAGLIELGPFGFRGPAASYLPHFLTADDRGVRTVQVVSQGTACPSNRLYARVIEAIPESYLYGTSANRSRQVTGAEDEPVHYRLGPLQADFGRTAGFFMVGSADECAVRQAYPRHASMSTTLVSFHKLGPASGQQPHLVVERSGSLAVEDVRRVAAQVGLGPWLAPAAVRRLSQRDYLLDRAPQLGRLGRAA